ncbi:MAG: double-strand break repair helicase AddA [Rhodospirillaceae bacterium]|nr:double-strand break repair helicase AddA [Rhodospirillaceae bacterium]MDE0617291.1 double-strand break repair helicase AddA [Rhodospirillaceae bacterium]
MTAARRQKAPPDPKRVAERAQSRASKPEVSSWVGASAGTGKTHVLTRRVLRLLLNGAAPARILCLTFTKAAAAEMIDRIAARLGRWALMDNAVLRKDLKEITGRAPVAAETARARTLFATCLDVPGGMRIQTIHAFCQALLKRFPLEAGVPPHFRVIEEGDQRALLNGVRDRVLADAEPGRGPYSEELALLTPLGGPDDLTALLGEFLGERGRLRDLLKNEAAVSRAVRRLYDEAGFDTGASQAALDAEACAEGAFDRDGLKQAARALESGSPTDAGKAEEIAGWLAAGDAARAEALDDYAAAFLTGEHQPRARLATKGAVGKMPDILDVMGQEAARLAGVYDRKKALAVVQRSAALARLGAAVHQGYEAEKRRRAVLDFDDLILKAEDLLTRKAATEWVLYKLDGGIDHILVDEAQDTSPQQWRLVEAIAQEFFAGKGVEPAPADDGLPRPPRTVFAVGDIKQSIFSFQGADPVVFDNVREGFQDRVRAAGEEWSPVDLDVSFRSVQQVLDAVDSSFAEGPARDGVVGDGVVGEGAALRHTAWRQGQGGMVELWPVIAPDEPAEPEVWTLPEIDAEAASTTEELAHRIARQVRAWLDGSAGMVWDRSGSEPVQRAPRAGDIMILVRRRDALVEALIRALKDSAVPVAGTDRMVLTEQLAVMDVLAVADFLLLPEDDLTLATVLKGPLFGFDDDRLFDLAHGRGRASLWSRLQAADDDASREAAKTLSGLLATVDYTPPYELLKAILTGAAPPTPQPPLQPAPQPTPQPTGRERFWGRLGPDAIEPLEELLNLALAFQRDHPPSLQHFLHWLRRREVETRRDMESVPDAVRIMTVHGAKGLQAPIVILPDTIRVPKRADRLLWPAADAGAAGAIGGLPLIAPSDADADIRTMGFKDDAREAGRQEYNRLLYVAMTRAQDALIVCGSRGPRKIDDDCWHTLVERGLRRLDGTAEVADDGFDEPVMRYGSLAAAETPPREAVVASETGAAHDPAALQALLAPPPPEAQPPRPLAPSRPAEDEPPVFGPFDAGADRFRRGALIHRLLQYLPDLPEDRRDRAALRYLARPGHGLTDDQQREIAAEIRAVLDLPEARPLFGPGSMAEAPVTGTVGGAVISGQIDRLAIGAQTVSVVDYKTNRPPPADAPATPPVYLRQMAAYRALLRRLYPARRVDCFLLWTAAPRLMALADSLLDPYAPESG